MKNKKRILIIALLAAVFLLAVSFFLRAHWQRDEKSVVEEGLQQNQENTVKHEPVNNYLIDDSSERVTLKNERVGLSFKVPDGWEAQKIDLGDYAQEIKMSSPEKEAGDYLFPKKGCVISVFTTIHQGEESRPKILKKRIEEKDVDLKNQRIVEVGGKKAIETTFYKDSDKGKSLYIEVPGENVIYHFSLLAGNDDREKCLQSLVLFFDNLLID